jgi:hypothetical protein
MAEEAGRDPQSLSVTLGGATEDLDLLKRNRDLGIARMNVRLPPAKADEILPVLDRWAKITASSARDLHREGPRRSRQVGTGPRSAPSAPSSRTMPESPSSTQASVGIAALTLRTNSFGLG